MRHVFDDMRADDENLIDASGKLAEAPGAGL